MRILLERQALLALLDYIESQTNSHSRHQGYLVGLITLSLDATTRQRGATIHERTQTIIGTTYGHQCRV